VIDHLHGGIVTQDLGELKEAVEALAWVRSASLRRVWPDRLDLTVVEHKPLCRWGEDGLVSDQGVVFRPPVTELPKGLPTLAAVDDRAPLLVARYRAWSPRFAARGLGIERMLLDARGAWSLRTGAGFELALGKLEVEERAGRFLRAWPSLAAVGSPEQVDMRYSNGLSVRWNMSESGAPEDARAQAAILGEPGTVAGGGRPVNSHPDRVSARIHDFLPRSPRS
jgi:cell division protein FtsQ